MKFDTRLVTGIFIGVVVGLHYGASLATYLPIVSIVALVLVLNMVRR